MFHSDQDYTDDPLHDSLILSKSETLRKFGSEYLWSNSVQYRRYGHR